MLSFYMIYPRMLELQVNVVVTTTFQTSLNTSLFEEFLENLSLIILSNWLIICGGWLELLFIYNSRSLGFYRFMYAIIKIKCLSNNSTTFELVCMSVLNSTSLNILMMLLRVRSICCPFTLRKLTKPSSL